MAKNKYYVVWTGRQTGIFDNWPTCQEQIKGFNGAKFKGFATLAEAQRAFNGRYEDYANQGNATSRKSTGSQVKKAVGSPIHQSLAVDAACSGNPGVMEYRGVYTKTGEVWFHKKFPLGTNNIGEFLALVHGIALLEQKKINIPLYTDSRIAMTWVNKKKCGSKLEETAATADLFKMVRRAENWLKANKHSVKILKWDTKNWGEIPADFGRK